MGHRWHSVGGGSVVTGGCGKLGPPLWAIGVVVAGASVFPFVRDHLTNVLFVVLGFSLVVVDMRNIGRAWGATWAMIAVTLGFVAQAAGSGSSLLPGWTFGAVVAGLGAVLLAHDLAHVGAHIPAAVAASPLPLSRTLKIPPPTAADFQR
ncbi:MAG: hypothetical protein ACR2GX_01045 [Candidatus Dormibacteria bacterium]